MALAPLGFGGLGAMAPLGFGGLGAIGARGQRRSIKVAELIIETEF